MWLSASLAACLSLTYLTILYSQSTEQSNYWQPHILNATRCKRVLSTPESTAAMMIIWEPQKWYNTIERRNGNCILSVESWRLRFPDGFSLTCAVHSNSWLSLSAYYLLAFHSASVDYFSVSKWTKCRCEIDRPGLLEDEMKEERE